MEINSELEFPEMVALGEGCKSWVQFADDHAFEVSFSESAPMPSCTNFQLTFEGKTYTMKQLHFHTPSEHAFGGGLAAAEVHMVHKSDDGSLLVVGVMLEEMDILKGMGHISLGNELLNKFWEQSYTQGKAHNYVVEDDENLGETSRFEIEVEVEEPLNVYAMIMPSSKAFYTYSGSLTTYPCTQGVTWILMKDPAYVSISDVHKLTKGAETTSYSIVSKSGGASNRPLQPVNSRVISYYPGVEAAAHDDGGHGSTDDAL